MTGHTWGVSSLVTLSNGNLESGSDDDTVKIWNITSGLLVYTSTWHIWDVYTLVTLQNGNLASDSGDNTIKIWNTNTGKLVFTLTGHTGVVRI
jgi:WD40 repeat protein